MPREDRREILRVVAGGSRYLLAFLAVWVLLFAIHTAFPYIRSGVDVVVSAKQDHMRSGEVFPPQSRGRTRVVVFGSSKVLAGFRPDLFDEVTGGRTYSYNAGIPGSEDYLGYLERVASGPVPPDYVFLLSPWKKDRPRVSGFNWFRDDAVILDRLFPFRHLPRDSFLFLVRSRSRGGPAAFYAYGRSSVDNMMADRGWYFISGQSHHADDRLPEKFALSTDRQDRVASREIPLEGPDFERVSELAERYGFHVVFVPGYFRQNEYAPARPRRASLIVDVRASDWLDIVGPDYVQFDNRYFSDPVHLNPEGASRYTATLAQITARLFSEEGRRADARPTRSNGR